MGQMFQCLLAMSQVELWNLGVQTFDETVTAFDDSENLPYLNYVAGAMTYLNDVL